MKKILLFLLAISFCSCEQLRHGNSTPFMSGLKPRNFNPQCGMVSEYKFVK